MAIRGRASRRCAKGWWAISAAAARTTGSLPPCSARPRTWGGPDMNASLNRREFAAGLGAIVVAFSLDAKVALAQEPPRLPGSLQTNRRLDAWLRINPD